MPRIRFEEWHDVVTRMQDASRALENGLLMLSAAPLPGVNELVYLDAEGFVLAHSSLAHVAIRFRELLAEMTEPETPEHDPVMQSLYDAMACYRSGDVVGAYKALQKTTSMLPASEQKPEVSG